jgi:hypothetical protein
VAGGRVPRSVYREQQRLLAFPAVLHSSPFPSRPPLGQSSAEQFPKTTSRKAGPRFSVGREQCCSDLGFPNAQEGTLG